MEERIHVEPDPRRFSRFSWGSVFAGTIMALVIQFTLVMLGLTFGFATINPTTEQDPLGGLGWGTGIWWIVTSILALFVGGWTAARFAGMQRTFNGALHGLVVWGLTSLLTVYLLSATVGSLAGGALGLMTGLLSTAGQMVQSVVSNVDLPTGEGEAMPNIREEIEQFLAERGIPRIEQDQRAVDALERAIENMLTEGDMSREEIINMMTRYTTASRQEAQTFLQRVERAYDSAKSRVEQGLEQAGQTAEKVTGKVADALATGALWSFFTLLLSGLAAALGGFAGRVRVRDRDRVA